jgi:4-amino-4-deoxy-L-arabinose transferase-like glycosyltransferase
LLLVFIALYGFFLVYAIDLMSVQWDEMPHLYGSLLLSRGQTWEYMTTYAYYPPLFDAITLVYFHFLDVHHAIGRLVAVTFSMLSVVLLFEFTRSTYGPKNALLASILLGTMPGIFWVSRLAMLETMLVFFFLLIMFFFYSWITKNDYRTLFLSGLTLGIGILAKYQIVVAVLAMGLSILFICRKRLKINIAKLFLIILIAFIVITPWFFAIYHYNGMTKFETIQYVMQEGGEERPFYSNRFQPIPVFYLVEMTWPFSNIPVHPISLSIFILGLWGLGLFAYRRNKQDIFLLTWFVVVYVFFTLIPNRHWRYVTPLFPILAISAACFIFFLYQKVRGWKPNYQNKVEIRKLASWLFILLITSIVVISSYDAYQMTTRDQINIPIEETANYLANNLQANESAVIVFSFNLLNQDMLRFYLPADMSLEQVWQYPELPVDAYTPNFDIYEFISLCEQRNVKYIILYDWGPHSKFFNTTLDYTQVLTMIHKTGRFGDPLDQPFFGEFANNKGHRLFLVRFLG